MTFFLPPLALQQHISVLGKTGAGKTNTGKVIVEHGYDQGERVCIFDPIKSDWWGLTASRDGKLAGLPFYILGGPYGHLPLLPHSGKAIAALVASGELPYCILDMADFPPGGHTRFFADFAPIILRQNKGVLRLVLEEAHEFAPKERVGFEKENYAIHYAKKLGTAGRTKGIRMQVQSQRTQAVHNALLGSCDTMIAQRFTAPADVAPVALWLKANVKDKALREAIEASISDLATGEAWVCSGEAKILERVKIPYARTFDNTKTPDGSDQVKQMRQMEEARKLMYADQLGRLRDILGKTAEEALANDPATLRKQIAALTADLEKLRAQPAVAVVSPKGFTEKEVEIARRGGWRDGYSAGATEQAQRMAELALARTQSVIDHVRAVCDKEIEATRRTFGSVKVAQPPKERASLPDAHPAHDTTSEVTNKREPDYGRIAQHRARETNASMASVAGPIIADVMNGVATGLRGRILGALRWLEDRGMRQAPRAALGAIAQCQANSGHGSRIVGAMLSEGLIASRKGLLELTDSGRAVAPEPPGYPSLVEAWLDKLVGLHRDVVDTLYANGQVPVTRAELGQMLGKQFGSGHSSRVLGELKDMGAVEYDPPGSVRLTRYVTG